jgi:ribosomal protein S18 acetylase RimI-like enzyme
MSTVELNKQHAWLAQVQIRQLGTADLLALEWEGAYTHFRRVYARAYERAKRGEAALWIAADETGRLIGQVFVLLLSQTDPSLADGRQCAFIHSFRVRPDCRRAGLGSRLLKMAEADLIQRGFVSVSLNVARENRAAIRLYERRGYRRLHPVSGDWIYADHLGVQREMHEPGWRMSKSLA